MEPLFSIIIPVYNVAPYLRACLDSILAQKFTGWEVVCVDDGSSDGSGVILDEYSSHDSRFRVFHRSNAGVSAARNLGMDKASGVWLYFLDADDVIVKDAFEILTNLVKDDRYDAFFLGGPIYFRDIPPVEATGTNKIIMDLPMPQSGKPLLMTGKLWGWPVIRLLRRTLFKDAKFPLGVANLEDSISLIDVLSITARWCWIDTCIYGYRVRPESASRLMTVEKVAAIINGFGCMYASALRVLGCSHEEALVLIKQYSSHMSAYLARGIPSFSAVDIQQLYIACRAESRKMNYCMVDVFLSLILYIAYCTQTKIGCSLILAGRTLFLKIENRLKRMLTVR